jgi:hypothetical protein
MKDSASQNANACKYGCNTGLVPGYDERGLAMKRSPSHTTGLNTSHEDQGMAMLEKGPSHTTGLATGQEDQCLAMLEKMNIWKEAKQRQEMVVEPIAENLKEMKILGGEEDNKKSTKGVEEHWEEFSDPEEEREALKLIAEAEVELLKEYAGYKTPRKAATSMTPSQPPSKKRRMQVKKTSAEKKSPSSKRCEQPRKTGKVLEDAAQVSEQHRRHAGL